MKSIVARKIVAHSVSTTASQWKNNIDVAVVFLASPLDISGRTEGSFTPIYPHASSALKGKDIATHGYGHTWAETDDFCAESLDGKLRRGYPNLSDVYDSYGATGGSAKDSVDGLTLNNELQWSDNDDNGTIQHHGDSGSAAFYSPSVPNSAFGVLSSCLVMQGAWGIGKTGEHWGTCRSVAPERYREFVLDAIRDETKNYFPTIATSADLDRWDRTGTWTRSSFTTRGALAAASATSTSRAVSKSVVVESAIISVDLDSSSSTSAGGLVVRYVDADNFYRIKLSDTSSGSTPTGKLAFVRVKGGTSKELASISCPVDIAAGKVSLWATLQDDTLFAFVLNGGNATCIINAEDSYMPTGRIGVERITNDMKFGMISVVHTPSGSDTWPLPS
jgi:hypothetical protein